MPSRTTCKSTWRRRCQRLWSRFAHLWRGAAVQGEPVRPEATDPQAHAIVPRHRRHLLRLMAQCQTSQRDLARLVLRQWARQADCPPEALALAAALDLAEGDTAGARRLLHAPRSGTLTASIRQLRILTDLHEDLRDSPRREAAKLAPLFTRDSFTGRWLSSMHLQPEEDRPAAPYETVDELAGQLLRCPQVIPTLVESQRYAPKPHRIELLRRTLGRLVEDVTEPLPVIEALAELAALADDADDARRWATRALRIKPYAARMALLLDAASSASTTQRDHSIAALEALRRAAAAQPNWPDVRRALIRRYRKAGWAQAARHRAQQWLNEQPDNPIAQQTWRETAA